MQFTYPVTYHYTFLPTPTVHKGVVEHYRGVDEDGRRHKKSFLVYTWNDPSKVNLGIWKREVVITPATDTQGPIVKRVILTNVPDPRLPPPETDWLQEYLKLWNARKLVPH